MPPATINGVDITESFTGSVSRYPNLETSCFNSTIVTTPANSVYLGQVGTFSYTMNFNKPINNLVIAITATGSAINENFIVTTNNGTPTILTTTSCFTTINGNEIISGLGARTGGGGGIFTIFLASNDYTSITISGNGGAGGSLLSVCSSSVSPDKKPNSYFNQSISICQFDSFKIGQNTYKTNGSYKDTFVNYLNVDSVVTTTLKVIPATYFTQNLNLCQGRNYKIGKSTYTNNGSYIDTIKNKQGCDSIVTSNLTFKPQSFGSQTIILCNGESLKVGKNNYKNTGIYNDTIANYIGCDSIITSTLTIKPTSFSLFQFVKCPEDSIFINGILFTGIGLFKDTQLNYAGCDSIIHFNIETPKIITNCDDAVFYIPTAFTPNFDELNDKFKVIGKNIREINMQIFNRWGEQLLNTTSQSPEWDGSYKNKTCADGVYLYFIHIQGTNGKRKIMKGTFTLLR